MSEISPSDFLLRTIETLRYEATACPDRVIPLLDQNWITFLVNSSHQWRGSKLDRSDEERGMEGEGDREKNDTGNPAEMNRDYFYDVSQSFQWAWQQMGEVFVGDTRAEGLDVKLA